MSELGVISWNITILNEIECNVIIKVWPKCLQLSTLNAMGDNHFVKKLTMFKEKKKKLTMWGSLLKLYALILILSKYQYFATSQILGVFAQGIGSVSPIPAWALLSIRIGLEIDDIKQC